MGGLEEVVACRTAEGGNVEGVGIAVLERFSFPVQGRATGEFQALYILSVV